jgi:hypothetical protein
MKLRRRSLIIIFFLFFWFIIFIWTRNYEHGAVKVGVTFSHTYAQALGLDWKEAYSAMLSELSVRKLRLIAYWPVIEPEEGRYDFQDINWQLDEAKKVGAEVILAVGRRLPRWPECHEPLWAKGLSEEDIQEKVLSYVSAVVTHLRDETSIVAWQVENEPFLSVFGECHKLDVAHLTNEVNLVRELDSRPIMITDSGELSFWWRSARFSDIFGSTLYRVVWNKRLGYVQHIFPESFYYWRKRIIERFFSVQKVVVSELQGEPWIPGGDVRKASFQEQMLSLPLPQLKENFQFAKRAGFDEIYWWGVEWWYWLKLQGKPEFWDAAQRMMRNE